MLTRSTLVKLLQNKIIFATRDIRKIAHIPFTKDDKTEKNSVCIVGGGMVGLYTALAFSKSPYFGESKLTLVEAGPNKPINVGGPYSNRVVALSPQTKKLLTDVGVWEKIENVRVHPVQRMQVWEDQSDAYITMEKDEMASNMAYIVENSLVMHCLRQALEEAHNVQLLYEKKLLSVDEERQNAIGLEFNDGTCIDTQLLVGSDGFNSTVRNLANIHTLQWKHNQKAIVANLELEEESNDSTVAWQRFLKTGPVAFLPLDSKTSSLVWSTTPGEADRLMGLTEEQFIDELNSVMISPSNHPSEPLGSLLSQLTTTITTLTGGGGSPRQLPPKVLGTNSRATFPLGFMHSSNYVWHRTALVGDAAHRILPLAGQGVNLGFGDAACLIDKMEQSVYDGEDVGQHSYLKDYESERQRFVVPVVATIEALYRLYATDFAPVVLGRSLGLQITNSLPQLKKFIVNSASSGKLTFEL